MELFYTVISAPGNVQSNPSNSLGGFCSGSKVQSGEFNALFSDISVFTEENGSTEYIALILKNTLNKSVKNIKFWMDVPGDSECRFRISLASPNENGEMESIANLNSKPLYAEFSSPTEKDPIELDGVFEPEMELGVWIERLIDPSSKTVSEKRNCDFLFRMFQEKKSLPGDETVGLKIYWEDV